MPQTQPFFDTLHKRIQEREEQLRGAQAELREVETRIAHLSRSLARLKDLLRDEEALARGDVPPEVTLGAATPPPRAPVVELVKGILERRGQPMRFAELWNAFQGCGYHVGGKSPRNTPTAHLSNYHKRGTVFKRTPDGRWALREWK